MWMLAGKPEAIYFDTAGPNAITELERVGHLAELYERPVHYFRMRWMGKHTEPGGFVPWRNLLFMILTTFEMGPGRLRVLIGQTLEWQVDKNAGFYRDVRRMARRLGHRDVVIEAPLVNMTKTEAVRLFLADDRFLPAHLAVTHSCLGNGPLHCGRCSSCIQRYVAFKNNGLGVGLPGEALFEFKHLPTWADYVENAKTQRSLFRPWNMVMYARRYAEARRALGR
ncbi:MAG: hypothetical protein A3J75_04990 [Acidobacteria bacterium RBG_16_68_9]|nr:MAG: hypothetical protein A3J75_04990 [Acidobacteria bacterium RBG_16_68_9]